MPQVIHEVIVLRLTICNLHVRSEKLKSSSSHMQRLTKKYIYMGAQTVFISLTFQTKNICSLKVSDFRNA